MDPESIEVIRAQPKGGVLNYEIRKIELSEGGREALETLGLDQPVAQVGKVLILTRPEGHFRKNDPLRITRP